MKYSLIIAACLFAGAINAQRTTSEKVKEMSVEEANRLNGTVQPTINGKPYGQYKAEQDALKQKSIQQQRVVNNDLRPIAASPSDAKQQPVQTRPVENSKPENMQGPKQQPVVDNNKVLLAKKEQESTKPQVPEQFQTKEPQPWNGTAVANKVTTPTFDPVQKPGAVETNVSKPVMQPDKADKNPAEVNKALIAEKKVVPATESKLSSEKIIAPVVTVVKDSPEPTETKAVVATPQNKGN